MPTFRITSPDGRTFDVTGPEGSTAEQALAQVQAQQGSPPEKPADTRPPLMARMQNLGAGVIRGAGSIGATILTPYDLLAGNTKSIGNPERRAGMDNALQSLGVETDSTAYGAGKLGGEIAGTMGTGGALANLAGRVPGVAAAAPNALNALRTSGMVGGPMATRAVAGAATGGASAGLVDPNSTGTGAVLGGVLPGAVKAVGAVGSKIGSAARSVMGQSSPEVVALANRAKELGIDIPADRLVNSKAMDAVASGLNYVPFSGRAATEARMAEQLNRAGSKLIGQDTPNMMKAIRAAGADLGAKFDTTLKSTGVAFDKQLLDDVSEVFNTAERELGGDSIKAIASQVDELLKKGESGVIDGQAAYNIKRTLDRIGQRNAPEAFHALELKGKLMDALNRSLGPDQAAAFAKTRQQYGNMLALEKLAKNGVEGEISVARLANLKNINNEPLQELADIAAQFVKAREGQHGAMQRAVVGLGAGSVAGPVGIAGVAAGGRVMNSALNSNALRGLVSGQSNPLAQLSNPELQQLLIRAAPGAAAGR